MRNCLFFKSHGPVCAHAQSLVEDYCGLKNDPPTNVASMLGQIPWDTSHHLVKREVFRSSFFAIIFAHFGD